MRHISLICWSHVGDKTSHFVTVAIVNHCLWIHKQFIRVVYTSAGYSGLLKGGSDAKILPGRGCRDQFLSIASPWLRSQANCEKKNNACCWVKESFFDHFKLKFYERESRPDMFKDSRNQGKRMGKKPVAMSACRLCAELVYAPARFIGLPDTILFACSLTFCVSAPRDLIWPTPALVKQWRWLWEAAGSDPKRQQVPLLAAALCSTHRIMAAILSAERQHTPQWCLQSSGRWQRPKWHSPKWQWQALSIGVAFTEQQQVVWPSWQQPVSVSPSDWERNSSLPPPGTGQGW